MPLDCPLHKINESLFGVVYTFAVILGVITIFSLMSVKNIDFSLTTCVAVGVGVVTGLGKLLDLSYLILLPFWSVDLLVCAILFLLFPMRF